MSGEGLERTLQIMGKAMMMTDTAVDLDLTQVPFTEQAAPVLRAASRAEVGEHLRVSVQQISWSVMAALNIDGLSYRILKQEPGRTEFVVWRKLTDEQRRSYLRDRLRPRYPGEYQLDRSGPGIPLLRQGADGE